MPEETVSLSEHGLMPMNSSNSGVKQLTDEDRTIIMETFYEAVVPKLKHHGARMGNIGCGFAGERYRNWTLAFRERSSDFEILELVYDEDGGDLELDL